jgi:predicted AAA+ superfamily ATPase
MKRMIFHQLQKWKKAPRRKPLLLRGARQVGKTYITRKLGKEFPRFVEVNLELPGV